MAIRRMVTVPTFVRSGIIEGITDDMAYRLIREDKFPFPVIKLGRLIRIDVGLFKEPQSRTANSEAQSQGEATSFRSGFFNYLSEKEQEELAQEELAVA